MDADGGVVCASDAPDCAVPTNAAIELRFDRFLLPDIGLTAGLSVFSGDPKANAIALTVQYDMLERVVIFRPRGSLRPNTLYTAQVVASHSSNQGFWAFDGAPLEDGPVPSRFSFVTGSGPLPASTPTPSAAAPTCASILSGPLASCGGCHFTTEAGGVRQSPPMGLDLAAQSGLVFTGIGHVAHQTETGNSSVGPGLQSPDRFGVQMDIIDPGVPASSYLMYKLLRNPQNFAVDAAAPCVSPYHPPVSDAAYDCKPAPDDELARLREWFVLGDPMPRKLNPSDPSEPEPALSYAELVQLSGWISAGADCSVP